MNTIFAQTCDQFIRLLSMVTIVMATDFSDLRIVGEADNVTVVGYVQVFRAQRWETVCDHGWSEEDARITCEQLGYDRGVSFHVRIIDINNLTEPYWNVEMLCTSEDERLEDCRVRKVSTSCSPAPVSCDRKDPSIQDGELRLSDGGTVNAGQVEVAYQGHWGGICDRDWDETSAGVVCGLLGYTEGGTALYASGFGPPFEVFLDAVKCRGGEKTIKECTKRGYMDEACHLLRTAGVVCHDEQKKNLTGQIQLVGGDGPHQGYLAVSFYGVWGGVCGTDWGDKDAGLVCRQLGYTTGRRSEHVYEHKRSPVWLNSVHCVGNETKLTDCTLSRWQDYYCELTDLVKIECQDGPASTHLDDDRLTTIYIVLCVLSVVVVIIIVVVILTYKKKHRPILIREQDKLGPKLSDTRNPLYNIDTSIFRSLTPLSIGEKDSKYSDGGPKRSDVTSGVYNYLIEDKIYLDLIDDAEMAGILPTNRANTPLPDLPVDEPSPCPGNQDDGRKDSEDPDGYLVPAGSRLTQCRGNLEPVSQRDTGKTPDVKDNNKHKYVNVAHVSKDTEDTWDEDVYIQPVVQRTSPQNEISDNINNELVLNPNLS